MKTKLKLREHPGVMACDVLNIPGFPGGHFTLAYPEAIGDTAKPVWYRDLKPTWEAAGDGVMVSRGERTGELSYELTLIPGEDCVTTRFTMTNRSDRVWKHGMAFNCFQCAWDSSIRDNECLRTWVGTGDQFKRLIELPRVFGPRPALQLYNVAGAPPAQDIPFVAEFQATPDLVIEPWMAIVSRDGKRLVATVSKPGLFLFQNREFSCIHCGTGFGQMSPGQSSQAVNKVYFVTASLAQWHRRMTKELETDYIAVTP